MLPALPPPCDVGGLPETGSGVSSGMQGPNTRVDLTLSPVHARGEGVRVALCSPPLWPLPSVTRERPPERSSVLQVRSRSLAAPTVVAERAPLV